MKYPRNLLGYGQNTPKVSWPNSSKIAIQFVINYEEGVKIVYFMAILLLKLFYLK